MVGGTLAAGSANALNCVYDRDIDEQMRRTRRRPLPRHMVTPARGAGLRRSCSGVLSTRRARLSGSTGCRPALALPANVFYVVGYTMVLKRRTPQNIVWGGAAGCFPALIGWTAVTGALAWAPVVLFARRLLLDAAALLGAGDALPRGLRQRRRADAAGRGAGREVGRQIVLYSWVMVATSLLLWPVAGTGLFYPVAAAVLGAVVPGRGAPAVAPGPRHRGPRA